MIQSALIVALAVAAPAQNGAEEVRALILEGAKACAEGRPEAVVAHYSRDIVLAYPGVPDQDYSTILAGYRRLCRGEGEGTVESTVPTFHEVTVMGKVAIVRLTWTTRLRGMPAGATRQLTDFQVWRRGRNGWEFVRGVHYPVPKPS